MISKNYIQVIWSKSNETYRIEFVLFVCIARFESLSEMLGWKRNSLYILYFTAPTIIAIKSNCWIQDVITDNTTLTHTVCTLSLLNFI